LVLACVFASGCQKMVSTSASPAATPGRSGNVGAAAPFGLDVVVARNQALVTWNKSSVGPSPRGYELRLDSLAPVRLPASATSHRLSGLKPGTDHTVSLVAISPAGRSPTVTAEFSVAAAPTITSAPKAAPAPAAAPRVPKGQVVIDRFDRLPAAQQTRYGCDRVAVTLANRSDTAVKTVTVGFVTYWGAEKLGSGTQRGRNVTLTQQKTIAAGALRTLNFDVCLPEKKTRNVYAEPVSTTWVWAGT